jgi:hypothetical protein
MRTRSTSPLLLSLLLVGCSADLPPGPNAAEWEAAGLAARSDRAPVFPDRILLPNGFQPEGITVGRGTTFYVGSLAGPAMGSIYRGDLRTGEGSILVSPAPGTRQAVGLGFDERSGLLFVAGGLLSLLEVYHGETGAPVASFSVAGLGLANDLTFARGAVYVTDSFRPVLYRVPLGPGGAVDAGAAVEEIPLGGDYVFDPTVPFGINNNGIVSTPDGNHLVVVNYGTGVLYRVDPVTGVAREIELGGPLPHADGLALQGRTLYAVQNFLNQVSVVTLSPDFGSGTVTRVIADARFRIPTTAAIFGASLYAVNARFDVASPFEPGDYGHIDFDVVRVPR